MSKYIFLGIVIVGIIIYLLIPSGDDPKEIESVVREVLKAGEEKSLEGITEHFSLQYRDEYGATYAVVKQVVKIYLDNFDSFDGKYSDLKVSINEGEEGEKEAIANFDIVITGVKSGIPTYILGDEDSSENLTVTFKKAPIGGWKIIRVEGIDVEKRLY